MKLRILSVAHDVLYKVFKLTTRNVWGVQDVIITNQHPILSTTVCYKVVKLRYNSDCICPSGAYYMAMARYSVSHAATGTIRAKRTANVGVVPAEVVHVHRDKCLWSLITAGPKSTSHLRQLMYSTKKHEQVAEHDIKISLILNSGSKVTGPPFSHPMSHKRHIPHAIVSRNTYPARDPVRAMCMSRYLKVSDESTKALVVHAVKHITSSPDPNHILRCRRRGPSDVLGACVSCPARSSSVACPTDRG